MLSPSAQKVQDVLWASGLKSEVRELPDTTRSAAEAAAAIGCQVAQIAKSLVFRTKTSGKAVLVIASGKNRVDEKKLAGYLGEPLNGPTRTVSGPLYGPSLSRSRLSAPRFPIRVR